MATMKKLLGPKRQSEWDLFAKAMNPDADMYPRRKSYYEPKTEFTNKSGWPDPNSFGRAYKLPARAIMLDFIEKSV
jgi:hypothetical protein